jgi:hypothetical protein
MKGGSFSTILCAIFHAIVRDSNSAKRFVCLVRVKDIPGYVYIFFYENVMLMHRFLATIQLDPHRKEII